MQRRTELQQPNRPQFRKTKSLTRSLLSLHYSRDMLSTADREITRKIAIPKKELNYEEREREKLEEKDRRRQRERDGVWVSTSEE